MTSAGLDAITGLHQGVTKKIEDVCMRSSVGVMNDTKKFILACGLILAAIGCMVLVGWSGGWRVLTGVRSEYIPMAPNSAMLFLLLGTSLISLAVRSIDRLVRFYCSAVAIVCVLVAGTALFELVTGVDLASDHWLFRNATGVLDGIAIGRMSPISAVIFLLAGVLLLSLYRKANSVIGLLGTCILLAGLVNTMGYWFNAPLLYGGDVRPVSLFSSLLFMILGSGLVAIAGTSVWPLNRLFEQTTSARLLRQLLPVIFVITVGEDWLIARISDQSNQHGVLISASMAIFSLLAVYPLISRVIRGVGQDIDQNTATLQENERKLFTFLDSLPVGVFVISQDGGANYANGTAARLLGREAGKSVGVDKLAPHYHAYVSGTDQLYPSTKMPLVRALAGESCEIDDMEIRMEGTRRQLKVFGRPVYDQDGKIQYALAVFQDITEQRRAEEKMIKAKNLDSLGQLAGGIAHDFNNLLQGLLGNISLAKMFTPETGKAYEFLKNAESTYSAAKSLTNQLLAFSSGALTVKKTISPTGVIKETVAFTLSGSNVKAVFDLADDLPTIHVDDGQLRQVISNIVLNAREAMAAGGQITISAATVRHEKQTTPTLAPGQYLRISIRDQGPGIPPQLLVKIFDPYFSTKDRGTQKGMGLGLTLSNTIIVKHGGAITVDSVLGKGTTFHVFLPTAGETSRPDLAGPSAIKPVSGKKRVLVMDDDAAVSTVAASFLDQLGYLAEIVPDGGQAIDAFRKAKVEDRPYSLVILDLTIPGGIGGLEALRKLQEIDPDVKAVVSSGYAMDKTMLEYSKHGFIGVLVKPYKLETMQEILASVFPVRK